MGMFDGRVAIITGGSSGIGLATAKRLCRDGARVVIAARGEARGQEAERALRAEGGEAWYVPCDVSRGEDVRRLVDTAVERYGRLDLAVNNAALADVPLALTCDVSEEDFDRTLAVDLKGVWLCLKYQIPAMLRAGKGAIVNVSSVNGMMPTPYGSAYTTAKHGLHGLSRTAALEYAAQGIRVNVVCPGAHRTPMLEGIFEKMSPGNPAAAEAAYNARIPAHRVGDPAELAEAICWLLSDAASYVTGSIMAVDGGMSAGAI
ncbi:SDR family oxidoreductase [Pyxidicoccus fallax]|uniref:SDR family oxidoreductase n=1 Tax=Pyxidicoccus fallax TaxID=394095 RepID=A0A848LRF6_9BACT|nr:SDR family NAD(P)-dependent oxidoreductase [Pyxidicoccus fallax]NMO20497.1 SDR family oxidoreductase [Pyxidicoccus fallax]NPC83366.1 SDR family oxidoreductase [Pyxidicoccus fallax]